MLTLARHRFVQVAAVALAVGTVSVSPRIAQSDDLGEETLLDYETVFIEHAREIGLIIEVGTPEARGMKRAIGPIERGELTGEQLRREARVWEHSIAEARERLAAVDAPSGLGLAQQRAVTSYATYEKLAKTLGAIADRPDDRLTDILDRAVALGARGDDEFDAAAAVIQAARRDLGLDPQASLPDPARTLPDGVEIYDPDELYPEDDR